MKRLLFIIAMLVATACHAGETVVFDFYADWCGPCVQMKPVVERVRASGYDIRTINVDEQYKSVKVGDEMYRYGHLQHVWDVHTIPCVIVARESNRAGEVGVLISSPADKHVGGMSAAQLVSFLKSRGVKPEEK